MYLSSTWLRATARFTTVSLVAALALGACGGDDDNDEAENGTTGTTAARADRGEPTTGSGEIKIADATYAFTSESCSVGDGDTPPLAIIGSGSTGGREYQVEIVRSQPADNHVERAKLAFTGVIASVATNIASDDEVRFEVDDRTVTAEGLQFLGGGGAPSGTGSFTATCDEA